MAFQVDCFIRKNTQELRDKLEKLGHSICKCCEFDGADWLSVCTDSKMTYSVHGIGYTEKEGEIYGDITQEEVFQYFLKTTTSIDCETNEELFLALAALRDDTNANQWLTDGKIWGNFDEDSFLHPIQIINYLQSKGHKATVEEIMEHFKRKDIC